MLPWARKATIIWLICSTAIIIGFTVYIFIISDLIDRLDDSTSISSDNYKIFYCSASVFSIIINYLIIIYLNDPEVIAAYDRNSCNI